MTTNAESSLVQITQVLPHANVNKLTQVDASLCDHGTHSHAYSSGGNSFESTGSIILSHCGSQSHMHSKLSSQPTTLLNRCRAVMVQNAVSNVNRNSSREQSSTVRAQDIEQPKKCGFERPAKQKSEQGHYADLTAEI
jgi:hypothetical protein